MALSFNGSSSRVAVNTPSFPNVLTFSCWVNCNLVSAYSTTIAIGYATVNVFKYYIKSNGKTAGYAQSSGNVWDGSGSATIAANTWAHALVYLTVGGSASSFINGVSDIAGASGSAIISLNANSVFGDDASSHWFGGSMADPALWNAILSQAEITALALGTRPSKIRRQALVDYWPFDGYDHPALDRVTGQGGTLTSVSLVTGPPLLNPVPILPSLPDIDTVMQAMQGPPPPPFILMPQIVM
jgi:hypothetical protein